MTKSRVFVVQAPARRDGPRGDWVEKFDLTPAEAFGELVRCLPYGNVPVDAGPSRHALRVAFLDYDFSADYLLLLGDPVACARAVHVLAERQGFNDVIRALKWDRRTSAYSPYDIG